MTPDEVELLEAAVDTMASRHDGPALTEALDGFGWIELLNGAPEVAVPRVFAAQGRLGVWSAAFHDVLAAHVGELGADLDPTAVTVVVPPPRATTAGRAAGDVVSVDGLCIGARPDCGWYVVPATEPGGAAGMPSAWPLLTLWPACTMSLCFSALAPEFVRAVCATGSPQAP